MSTTRLQSMLFLSAAASASVVLLSLTVCMVSTTVSATTNGSQLPQQQHRSHQLFRRFLFDTTCYDNLNPLLRCSQDRWDVDFHADANMRCCYRLEAYCHQNKLAKEGSKGCKYVKKETLVDQIKDCTDKKFVTNEANCKALKPKDMTDHLLCKSYTPCYSDETPPPGAAYDEPMIVIGTAESTAADNSVRLSLWMAIIVIVIVVGVSTITNQ
ncbi:uncharacterized protein LOC128961339 [Oppia nitens]|uniref:uncharacterized protein LOC128961339 n=1 Tax=Oppia nitens TaxID=1686743 RepID=UPI0023DBE455|nr:uncharacterized protein LOC128961339 [Oppia nitens]